MVNRGYKQTKYNQEWDLLLKGTVSKHPEKFAIKKGFEGITRNVLFSTELASEKSIKGVKLIIQAIKE